MTDPVGVVHVVATRPSTDDRTNSGGRQPAGAVLDGSTVTFGEPEKVEQEMGLIQSVVWREVSQVGTKCFQFLWGKLPGGACICGIHVRCSLVGLVPAAHGVDVLGDKSGAIRQVVFDVFAGVAWGHGPVRENGGGIGSGEVLEPDQVGGEMIQDFRAGARKDDAHRHQFFGVGG